MEKNYYVDVVYVYVYHRVILQITNYRPVSLTSRLSKVMESVLRDEIVRHLDKHNLVRDSQHGFGRGRSCTSNLLEFFDRVLCVLYQTTCTALLILCL